MQRASVAAFLIALLAACAGGGGGGGGTTPPTMPMMPGEPMMPAQPQPFTSAQQVQPMQTVVMSGMTQSATISGLSPITAVTFDSVNTNVGFQVTAGGAPPAFSAFNGVSFPTSQGTASWSVGAGDAGSCFQGVCSLSNSTSDVVLVGIQNSNIGWNYQTFGIWDRDLSAGNTLQVGAFSTGAPTPGSAVPTMGAAAFVGMAMSFYVDSMGTAFVTTANMNANADFSARSIAFSTSNTALVNINTSAQSADNGLNLSGTFTYAAGTNLFSGPVATQNAALSGTGTGRFYGPAAQEIGGVYKLTAPSGVSSMVGAFGGAR
jgi:hypothetical protein